MAKIIHSKKINLQPVQKYQLIRPARASDGYSLIVTDTVNHIQHSIVCDSWAELHSMEDWSDLKWDKWLAAQLLLASIGE